MRIPMKVDYGVRALVELALHHGEGPLQTAEIAASQEIPEAYLDQLMTTLHKFGFVVSRRGPQGGHRCDRARAAGRGSISCPTCSKPVAVGAPTCPDCGQQLDWN